jgi:nucleoside-diphosphate-sugar epimerase
MEDFVRVNVHGTRNVLDAARDAGAERVVHVSSVASFGYEHSRELDEDAAPRPAGIPYIDTKAASDALALARGRAGEPIVVIRPGDVYGPGSTGWAVLPLEAIKQRRFMLVDGGKGILTPVYVDDLVESIVLGLTTDDAAGRAFTVWDGSPVTCAEFFNHYARMLGRDGIPSLTRAAANHAGAAQELVATVTRRPPLITREAIAFVSRKAPYSNRRAREVLGWQPRVDLEEGMRRTELWFREQGLIQ